jgi:hypothetical protein
MAASFTTAVRKQQRPLSASAAPFIPIPSTSTPPAVPAATSPSSASNPAAAAATTATAYAATAAAATIRSADGSITMSSSNKNRLKGMRKRMAKLRTMLEQRE